MNELDQLTVRAAVLKILNDRIYQAFKDAKDAVAIHLGPEGRKNAVLEGNKLASVSVTKAGRISVNNEPALLAWVQEHYPTEVEQVSRVRPAFLDKIKRDTEAAGEPCYQGELDIPGLSVGDPYPLVRKTAGADELVEDLWRKGRLSVDGEVREIE
jgi:hypothetical protein